MIKLVLTDLDSTLIWREDHVVSARALAAIRRAQAAGVHVVPCTGRHFRDLTWMFDGDAAACSTAVTSNGQLVYLDGELVERVPLPRAALSGLLDLLAGEPAAGLVVEIGEDKTVVGRDLDFARSHPDTFWGVSSSVPEVPEEPCYKANVRLAGSFARCEELAAELDRACPDLDFLLPMPGTPHIDVMPRGVGKDHGGDFLMERLGAFLSAVVRGERLLSPGARRLLTAALAGAVLLCTVTLQPPDLSHTSPALLRARLYRFLRLRSSG